MKIMQVNYTVQRIVWKLEYGEEPKELIDHKDGDKLNNRIDNLREANNFENSQNKKAQSNNKLGIKGVHYRKNSENSGKYRAKIHHQNKYHHLGMFNTAEEASLAYQKASLKYHGEFGNF